MRDIFIEKVTVNIGVGEAGERLQQAKELLELITGRKCVETLAKKRNPSFKLRKGLPIGVKVTFRGKEAVEFLQKALKAKKNVLPRTCFDKQGNFSFGIAEYIDFPGAKYNPNIDLFGFDVCVTLARKGKRVAVRRVKKAKIGKRHRISPEEAVEFVKSLGVKVE